VQATAAEVERVRLEGLSTIIDSTSDLIWSVDAERFRLVTFNRALRDYFRKVWGVELRQCMDAEEMLPHQDVGPWRANYRRVLHEGAFSFEYETEAEGLVLDLHLSPLVGDGRVFGISVFGRDVTEKRRALDQLQRSEAFFRAVQEASPDLSSVIGPDRRYRFVSAACRGVLGYEVEEVIHSPPLSRVHPDDAPRMQRLLDRVLAVEGVTERARFRLRHRDGSWRFLDLVARNEICNPMVGGILTNARDVTEQVRLSARLQAVREEEKTRIARDLHDELGQLLTGLKLDLLWMEERLESMEPTPIVSALVDRAVDASELAQRTLAEVQRLATDLRPAVLDRLGLGPALQQEGRRFEARTGVACGVEVTEPTPSLPASTSTALYRIAQEALTNIARHARARQALIHFRVGSGELELMIEDDGVGLDWARTSVEFGLGLAGMRERATLEGGELTIGPRPGGGTTVCARMPLTANEEGP
jgi:PAS domain S-box-containing protein